MMKIIIKDRAIKLGRTLKSRLMRFGMGGVCAGLESLTTILAEHGLLSIDRFAWDFYFTAGAKFLGNFFPKTSNIN